MVTGYHRNRIRRRIGFASLLLVRLFLGVGESVAFPSYSKILARNLPEYYRGTGNAVIGASQYCGPTFGTSGRGC